MKPELTRQLKEKFTAQYWGQKVFMVSPDAVVRQIIGEYFFQDHLFNESLLVLKPLSAITDEDAIYVAKLVWVFEDTPSGRKAEKNYHTPEQGRDWIMSCIDKPLFWSQLGFPLTDYLRSKSYALPFMGYFVEELVQAGWVKLAA